MTIRTLSQITQERPAESPETTGDQRLLDAGFVRAEVPHFSYRARTSQTLAPNSAQSDVVELVPISQQRLAKRVQAGNLKQGTPCLFWVGRQEVLDGEVTHIRANTSALVFRIVVDIDDPSKLMEWLGQGFPHPSYVVKNRDNDKAHLVWELDIPVCTRQDWKNKGPEWLLRALRTSMQMHLGGDMAYTHTVMKSPWSRDFLIYQPPSPRFYSLDELRDSMPEGWDENEARLHSKVASIEASKGGRNCRLFYLTAQYAYRHVNAYRDTGGRLAFTDAVAAFARRTNEQGYAGHDLVNGRCDPLSHREVAGVARSVTRWTWANYIGGDGAKESGRRGGLAKGLSYMPKVAKARELVDAGMTIRDACKAAGIAPSTFHNHKNRATANPSQGVQIAISALGPAFGANAAAVNHPLNSACLKPVLTVIDGGNPSASRAAPVPRSERPAYLRVLAALADPEWISAGDPPAPDPIWTRPGSPGEPYLDTPWQPGEPYLDTPRQPGEPYLDTPRQPG